MNTGNYGFSGAVKLRLIPSSILLFLGALPALAQDAQLSGRVTDPSGSLITNAKIEVRNRATSASRSTTTNADGLYILPFLNSGLYTLSASAAGFKSYEQSDVKLDVAQKATIDVTLQVGGITEKVTVEGGGVLVNSDDASVSTVVDRQFVENIPMNGRSFQSLIQIAPGVVLTKATSAGAGQFSVNGQRSDANYFTIDGVGANIGVAGGTGIGEFGGGALPGLSVGGGTNNLVSVDAMQEFRLQTSTYAPEFGRSPGAQVQIATRSGSNQFHGTASDYLRNDVLDANNWFNDQLGLPKAKDRQNDFGGVLGGPLWKDRTFFFVSYEGLRLRQPVTATSQVPSLATRQSAVPEIQPYLNAFPLPNGPVAALGFANFSASFSNPTTMNATSVRIDHTFNSKFSVFGRYNDAPSNTVQRGGSFGAASLNSLGVTTLTTETVTVGGTYLISPTVINEARFNWSRNRINNYTYDDGFGGAVPLTNAQMYPSFADTKTSAFLFILSGGTGSLKALGENAASTQRQINGIDSISWTVGAHQLKFGTDYRRMFPLYDPLTYEQLIFFNGASGAATGGVSSAETIASAGEAFPIFHNYSTFVQDTWKLDHRLTLTYGLRWDLNPPPHERNGHQFTVTGLDNPSNLALAPEGTRLWNTSYTGFAPRFGAAYQVSQARGHETVLRGGFGIFYDLGYGQTPEALGNSWPFTARSPLLPAMTPFPLSAANQAPPPFITVPTPSNPVNYLYVAVPNLRLPRTYQFNVAVEQALGASQTLTVSYVGAVGRDLLRSEILFNVNPLFQTVYVTRNTGMSNYDALQVEFNRRLSRRVQALISYSWAHSLDNASTDLSGNAPGTSTNLNREYGPSDFDVRHSFSGAVTYNLPTPDAPAVLKTVLRNWALDGIMRARTASPVNVVTGTDVFNLGTTNASRPDVVAGVPLYLNGAGYPGGKAFNPAAFSEVAAGAMRQGTLGRNALRGFSMSQLDLSVRRQIHLTERVNVEFKAESFNAFNHPNFADPVNTLNSVTFGKSTQMLAPSLGTGGINGGFSPLYQVGGPRSIQMAIKVQF